MKIISVDGAKIEAALLNVQLNMNRNVSPARETSTCKAHEKQSPNRHSKRLMRCKMFMVFAFKGWNRMNLK